MAEEEKKRILVVDDEISLIEGVRDILELAGYEILTAHNGKEGLALFQSARPDLVVADIMMPVMDGYEFCAQVRQLPYGVQTPFIFLTAKGEKGDIHRGRMLGADDYLTKPFEADDLLVIIKSRLNRAAAIEEVTDQEMDRLRNAIVRTLSHEFRTPLTFISGYTELLSESEGNLNTSELELLLKGLQEGSRRLQYLVDNFLFLVSLQAGSAAHDLAHSREAVSLLGVLQTVVTRKSREAAAKSVEIQMAVPDDLPFVPGNFAMLTSALERVLDNAIKFSPPGHSPITVSARSEQDEVVVVIADHGVGIPAEALPDIFRAFEQVNRDRQEQSGAGLGLAITKAIIELHGGTVSADSQPGKGTTITIALPAAAPAHDGA